MHATLELMRDQVRAIYRALTGTDMPEAEPSPSAPEVPIEEVARRFADLETMARANPMVIERVPPFSFAPPLDAIDAGSELIIELAVPGVDKGDVSAVRTGDLLVVSGVRSGERAANGRTYLHAEIPRGPFHRVVRLPFPTTNAEPRIDVDRGLIRIHLAKTPARA
jgi:HSP20 family molecular chaperone IbpA